MKIITISREFGSGGRELGKRLADVIGFDYYDQEIITAIAQQSGMSSEYIENKLNQQSWLHAPLTFRSTFSSLNYAQSDKVNLLLTQKQVIEQIAAHGRDCIIVGRNADIILQQYRPFSIFVCADMQAKLKRCIERAPEGEKLNEKDMLKKIRQIDKVRAHTREIMADSAWGDCHSFKMTVNTTDWDIKQLACAIAPFAMSWFEKDNTGE